VVHASPTIETRLRSLDLVADAWQLDAGDRSDQPA
jgi:hypothetical protein